MQYKEVWFNWNRASWKYGKSGGGTNEVTGGVVNNRHKKNHSILEQMCNLVND